MARPLRVEFEGALYHLTGRGNVRQRIFADEKDCAKFVQLLVESLQRYEVALHGYVLMGNHYHLIAETRRRAMSNVKIRPHLPSSLLQAAARATWVYQLPVLSTPIRLAYRQKY